MMTSGGDDMMLVVMLMLMLMMKLMMMMMMVMVMMLMMILMMIKLTCFAASVHQNNTQSHSYVDSASPESRYDDRKGSGSRGKRINMFAFVDQDGINITNGG